MCNCIFLDVHTVIQYLLSELNMHYLIYPFIYYMTYIMKHKIVKSLGKNKKCIQYANYNINKIYFPRINFTDILHIKYCVHVKVSSVQLWYVI